MLKRVSLVLSACFCFTVAALFISNGNELFGTIFLIGWLGLPMLLTLMFVYRAHPEKVLASLVAFQVMYSLFVAGSLYVIFGVEHDAGYQLATLAIPAAGLIGLVAVRLFAAGYRRWQEQGG